MTISPVTEVDLPAILEIQLAAFQTEADQYGDCNIPPLKQTLDDLRGDLATKVFLKAVESGQIVGSIRGHLEKETCHVEKLSVSPEHQGRGYGAQLLRAIEGAFPQATRLELFTGSRSEKNIRLYKRLGYRTFREQEISCRLTLLFMEKDAAST